MGITLAEMMAIGDRLVASIAQTRLENDATLRNAVENYRRIRDAISRSGLDDLATLRSMSESIRAIEARLDIVSPD